MIKITRAVVVEGKYDKIKLGSMLDTVIVETNGFGIFKDPKRLEFIRRLAVERGIVIATDSDRSGFLIRHYIQSAVPPEQIVNVYIPEILGKEKRKLKPSKAGTLGVEGLEKQQLIAAFERAGVLCQEETTAVGCIGRVITKADLYDDGLSGRPESACRRRKLLQALDLPRGLSANALLPVLNTLFSYEQYRNILDKVDWEEER